MNYFDIPAKAANIRDKENGISYYVRYMLSRTQSMFEYSGCPETLPPRMLELYLQTNGNCFVTNVDGSIYAFTGGLGGVRDAYYRPTIYTVANPYLNLSRNYNIEKDGVLIYGDSMLTGLVPMFERYATQLVENDVSIRVADINMRIASFISASDDKTQKSAQEYIKQITDGNLAVIGETALLDGVKIQPGAAGSTGNYITQLIELQQYLKAGWYNDIGLQSNYNMKRESINSNESQMNEDCLLPLVDDMLRCREIGLEKVNSLFGLDISVSLNSAWKELRESPDPGTPSPDESAVDEND